MKRKNMPGRKALRKLKAGSGTLDQYYLALEVRTKKYRTSRNK